ncbi:MAG TPA: TetR/AcrR family transcriptional regulator, partial [Mycobacterium sp.]|nr:TetR/AcrR family transcriptional regulator [Mycobacterium sp.]
MAAPEPPSAAGRQRAGKSASRPAKLSRDGIV